MEKGVRIITGMALAALLVGSAAAQEFVIFPAKGQSDVQTEQDKFTCYNWAKKESGFDPMAMPTATQALPPQSSGSVAGDAAKTGGVGALLGAGIGAIAGHGWQGAGVGAAIGALSGGFFGGMRSSGERQREEQAQQQWANQQASQYLQQRQGYNRAYTACLEGKGYVVK